MKAHAHTQPSRTAIGYVRVSTQKQATEGGSLDAQRDKLTAYCKLNGIKRIDIKADEGISVSTLERPGLQAALQMLKRGRANTLLVAKLDRLSRLIRHFCEIYETYFRDGAKALVAIREAIRLDSARGRALISILLVFAQMEREAIGERTREAILRIRRSAYHATSRLQSRTQGWPASACAHHRVLVLESGVSALLGGWFPIRLCGAGKTD